ncbi:oxidoreductase [Furfurilactobacillus sp. OKN36]
MNILILGGFGKLGQEVYRELAPLPEVNVTLFGRKHADAKPVTAANVFYGDATKVEDLVSALAGIDIVFSTLGPFEVEKYAVPLIEAMNEAGVGRLYWSTQFQIARPEVTQDMLDLAATFGFSEEVERNYVENQKLGASLIESSNLSYTLLLCHFFKYDDSVQKAIIEPSSQVIDGGPISVRSLAVTLSQLFQNPDDYRRAGVMISAMEER